MSVPTLLPILSAGAHPHPRNGGCFMEVASHLAGERWSDRPKSVHPLLGAVARSVNDLTSDRHRFELAPLIPDVIGTAAAGDEVALELLARCCEQALGYHRATGTRQLTRALTRVRALQASREQGRGRWRARRFVRRHGEQVVRGCCAAIRRADADPDATLRALLAGCIDQVRAALGSAPGELGEHRWRSACELVGGIERG